MDTRRPTLLLALLAAILALAGCAKKHRVSVVTPSAPAPPARILASETGVASWYGHPYHGRAAADGEIYDMEKLTAAHRTLPFGTVVRVTNLGNQKSVDVRIIDRGPFVDGRIIDLSHAAADALGFVGAGLAQVRVDVLALATEAAAGDWFAVQAGAFADQRRAERLRASLEREYGAARLVFQPGTPSLWRVLVGRERTEQAANILARRVRVEAGSAFVVRLDPSAAIATAPEPASSQP
ncbi:MAG: septal ring lytic transglycosylase RlpA family protein [Acidobacteriia bacterium]|nr:septal ring lytic transglycosylase RlpA family protein [Terriglobia bacterium]